MSDDALRDLAKKAGIATHWTDQTGAERAVSPESLRAILAALGLPAGTAAELRNSLALAGNALSTRPGSFVTARVGEPVSLPVPMAAGTPVAVEIEGVGERVVAALEGQGGSLLLPAFATPGYHRVQLPAGGFTVATAPPRCVTFADVAGRTGWGLAAQIYSLRSRDDGGIGNFAGVAALGRTAAARGADALAISPVHALYGALPAQFSPYSPSSRLFYNPLHADPAAALPEETLRELVQHADIGDEMAALSAQELIDWPVATALKQRLLRAVFGALRSSQGPASASADFELFRREASPLLRDHAVFEVLHAAELERDPHAGHWRDWRAPLRDPGSREVAAFAQAHAEEIDYQIFLQWLLGRSYAQAQKACRDAGMAVGLIADLAIGMDGAGSHAWSRQQDILIGLSIGAPPDYYAADGQNWGLTTFSPLGLAATGYAPFIETMRASLRHVGGIRIDHVMGMSRLWLIPEGGRALDGAYVALPSEAMFRLIALESWRHRAIVIGEDLGTLPYGFRDYLRDQGVAGLRVLRFERTEQGYVPPDHWNAQAAALTTTHDLVPTAGWWAGSDLDAPSDEQQELRAWDRGLLWGAFRDAGLVEGERPGPENTDPVVDAAVAYVAATPCALKIVPIEDALGIRTQPNVPGTTVEKPNWRHRLPGDAAELLDDEKVSRRLTQLERSRAG